MRQAEPGLTPRGQQWLATVEQWERSGLSMREFCERRGLRSATLAWWRWEIRRRVGKADRNAGRVEFVEIDRGAAAGGDEFSVSLANGLRIGVPMRFDAAALKELIQVLGKC